MTVLEIREPLERQPGQQPLQLLYNPTGGGLIKKTLKKTIVHYMVVKRNPQRT